MIRQKISRLILISILVVSLFPWQIVFAASTSNEIKDDSYYKELVKKNYSDLGNHWADVYIGKLVELGAISGMPDGTFKPNARITRAEFTKILVSSLNLKLEKGSSFADVHDWSSDYIYTAVKHGIIDKNEYVIFDMDHYEPYFRPDKYIDRTEMCKMIVRALGKDADAVKLKGQKTKFTDNNTIMFDDKGYIMIANENSIISGSSDGFVLPYNEATRAEASKMIVTMLTTFDSGIKVPDVSQLPTPVVDTFIQPKISVQNLSAQLLYVSLENASAYLGKGYMVKAECTNVSYVNKYDQALVLSDGYVTIDRTEWRPINSNSTMKLWLMNSVNYSTLANMKKYGDITGQQFNFKITLKNDKEQREYYVLGIAKSGD